MSLHVFIKGNLSEAPGVLIRAVMALGWMVIITIPRFTIPYLYQTLAGFGVTIDLTIMGNLRLGDWHQ